MTIFQLHRKIQLIAHPGSFPSQNSVSLSVDTAESFVLLFPKGGENLIENLAIIAELVLSYGRTHFYTYHKLFSAKCAVQVSQWTQCPYWGVLDTDLHNRFFLDCLNISCAVCRSVAHSITACSQVNPSIPPCPVLNQTKSSSYIPCTATTNFDFFGTDSRRRPSAYSSSRQVCNNFNTGKFARQRCQFLHICSYCSAALA